MRRPSEFEDVLQESARLQAELQVPAKGMILRGSCDHESWNVTHLPDRRCQPGEAGGGRDSEQGGCGEGSCGVAWTQLVVEARRQRQTSEVPEASWTPPRLSALSWNAKLQLRSRMPTRLGVLAALLRAPGFVGKST